MIRIAREDFVGGGGGGKKAYKLNNFQDITSLCMAQRGGEKATHYTLGNKCYTSSQRRI